MVLAVDAHRLCGQRFGVGRYLEYLLRHWAALRHPFGDIRLFAPCRLEPDGLGGGAGLRAHAVGGGFPLLLFHNVLLPYHARQADLLFCPAYFAPIAYRGRYVVTHHGSYEAIQHTFPWWHRYRYGHFYGLAARRAHTVITVSESSKRDIVRFYAVDPARVRVIPVGVSEPFTSVRDEAAIGRWRVELGIGGAPVVLYVGTLARRRCIPELLRAFAAVKAARRLPHVLVLAGANPLRLPLAREAARLGLGSALRHLPYVNHDRLPSLYHLAELFVYPSTYEGFGVPVIEAMACGTPVVTLDNTAFRETAAGAAHLAPDGSEDAIRQALDDVLTDPTLRGELAAKGLARARRFAWDRIAAETMAVLVDAARTDRAP